MFYLYFNNDVSEDIFHICCEMCYKKIIVFDTYRLLTENYNYL